MNTGAVAPNTACLLQAELGSISSPAGKLRRVARLGQIIANEFVGTLCMAPYGTSPLIFLYGLRVHSVPEITSI